MYRLKGHLLPTSVHEVAAAEQRLEAEPPYFPAALEEPPQLTLGKSTSPPNVGGVRYWTNRSVKLLRSDDPIEAITQKARDTVLSAIETGWSGPPYDPRQLAELLKISLVPQQDVVDARTRSIGGKFVIEFNPERPAARLRFSIAHEIAHTVFPDCSHSIRNRATHEQIQGDDWQLEMLCNIAAAEILMPTGSLPNPDEFTPTVESILKYRRQFQVSSESILLRLLRLTGRNCFAFAAHRALVSNRYKSDYVIKSRGFAERLPFASGFLLPKNARAAECTAIGFTSEDSDNWLRLNGDWYTQYLGIAPYPGQSFPRVLAIVRAADPAAVPSTLRFLKGDASEPRGTGPKILLQVVNDKAITWGAGFAVGLKKRWPSAQKQFTEWATSHRREFRLGAVHFTNIRDDLILASLVAQHGYGESVKPRLRYAALEECLKKVAATAKQHSATIHSPRIGAGLAGGAWSIIEEILQQVLATERLNLTIYDWPNQKLPTRRQLSLFDVPKDTDQFV